MTAYDLREKLSRYAEYLRQCEKSSSTVKQYLRDVKAFLDNVAGGGVYPKESVHVDKETVIKYKDLLSKSYSPASVNVKLAAINGFFEFLDQSQLKVKQLRIQRRSYASEEKELSREEYFRLIKAAREESNEKLAMIITTLCATGIRVSELRYITKDAVAKGQAVIHLKGKTRVILIPKALKGKLLKYMKKEKIKNGAVFLSRTGKPLERTAVWKMMKSICKSADVDPRKVFPHNLRHLFARCFYRVGRDIAKLSDILGHSSIDTTRIYLMSTESEHRKKMEMLKLII